jgi:parallel beta-helix repeat protein
MKHYLFQLKSILFIVMLSLFSYSSIAQTSGCGSYTNSVSGFSSNSLPNPSYTGCIEVTGNLTINQNLTLQGCFLDVQSGVTITVAPGVEFKILDSEVYGVNGMWRGIKINSSASRLEVAGTYFSDAVLGIEASNGAVVYLDNNEFNRNQNHIKLSNYQPASNPVPFTFTRNTLRCTGTMQNGNTFSDKGVHLTDVHHVWVGDENNSNNKNTFEDMAFGVFAWNSVPVIANNEFSTVFNNNGGGNIGVYAENGSSTYVMGNPINLQNGNTFNGNHIGIFFKNLDAGAAVNGNDFISNTEGIKIVNTVSNLLIPGYDIQFNNFRGITSKAINIDDQVSNGFNTNGVVNILMNEFEDSFDAIGIRVEDAKVLVIGHNSITDLKIGIQAFENETTEVFLNTITYIDPDGSYNKGIHLKDNRLFANIKWNDISQSATPPFGNWDADIVVEDSERTLLEGNTIFNSRRGVMLHGSMNGINLLCNRFEDCQEGVFIYLDNPLNSAGNPTWALNSPQATLNIEHPSGNNQESGNAWTNTTVPTRVAGNYNNNTNLTVNWYWGGTQNSDYDPQLPPANSTPNSNVGNGIANSVNVAFFPNPPCNTPPALRMAQAESFSFNVYPNPATDVLHIDTEQEGATLEIVDLMGKTVHSSTLFYGVNTLDITHLAKGIYLCRAQDQSGLTQTEKIIVQ